MLITRIPEEEKNNLLTILSLQTTKIAGSWKLAKKRERKQLARGRLRLRVASQNGAVITGLVHPRLMCGGRIDLCRL